MQDIIFAFHRYAGKGRGNGDLISFKRSTEWLQDAGVVGSVLSAEEATDAFKCAAGYFSFIQIVIRLIRHLKVECILNLNPFQKIVKIKITVFSNYNDLTTSFYHKYFRTYQIYR